MKRRPDLGDQLDVQFDLHGLVVEQKDGASSRGRGYVVVDPPGSQLASPSLEVTIVQLVAALCKLRQDAGTHHLDATDVRPEPFDEIEDAHQRAA